MKRYILFILLLCVSCSTTDNDSESDELSIGEFKGLVGESVNSGLYEELTGIAQFELDVSDTTFNFIFYSNLVSDTSATKILLRTKSLDMPTAGTYTFSDIEDTSEVYPDRFSGFYLSPIVGLNRQFFSESGTLTISSSNGVNGIKGTFEAKIFAKAQTSPDGFTRQYSTIKAEFFAVPKNLR